MRKPQINYLHVSFILYILSFASQLHRSSGILYSIRIIYTKFYDFLFNQSDISIIIIQNILKARFVI